LPEHTINKMICPQCHAEWPGDFVTCAEDGQTLKSMQDDPMIGQTFAERYQIVSVLGLGGMSVVYKAKHKLMDRMVAIKLMHAGLVKEPMALQRFQQESKAAASISHQNVVTVYDFGITAEGQAFFVMDCLEGPTLGDVIEKNGHLPVERAVNIFRQVCDGLECAHKKGVIHRDLKPANLVLLTQEDGSELVKIVDFGIAKFLPTAGKKGQSLTQVGEVFGSPLFMSPEQLQARAVDARSDVYALGCVMYETLTGVLAVLGDNVVETMNMHLSQKPKPFKEVAPSIKIPEEVEAVVFKCLEKSPSDRFQSAADVARALPDYGYFKATQGGAITGNGSRTAKSPRQFITINLKTDSKVLTWVSGVFAGIVAFSMAFLLLWNGPVDDRGTEINKIAWQLAISASDICFGRQDYGQAAKFTGYAESLAEKFGDGHSRLLETLATEAKIYRAANEYTLLKQVNDRISVVRNQKVVADYNKVMDYLNGLTASKDALRTRLNAVDAEASITKVLRASDELGATSMFAKQETLLRHCREVFERIGVRDGEIQASLDWALADCLFRQQKTLDIRTLLTEALSLSRKLGSNRSPGYVVRALLKLGIFDKDQSDFPKAKSELEEAVALSKKQSDKQLRVDCLSAYADYFHQLHQDDKAKLLYQEASKLSN
jgi:serine/threonine protein kinase